jgi:hypothetical protein
MGSLLVLLMTLVSAGGIYFGTKNLRLNKSADSDIKGMSDAATNFYSEFNTNNGLVTNKLKAIADVLNIENPMRLTHDGATRSFTGNGPVLGDVSLMNVTGRILLSWLNIFTVPIEKGGRFYSLRRIRDDFARLFNAGPVFNQPLLLETKAPRFVEYISEPAITLGSEQYHNKRIVFMFVRWQGETLSLPQFTLQSGESNFTPENTAIPYGIASSESERSSYASGIQPDNINEDLVVVIPVKDELDVEFVKNYFGPSMAETPDLANWARSVEYAPYYCEKNSSVATKLFTSSDEDLILPVMMSDQYDVIRAFRNVIIGADLVPDSIDAVAEYGAEALNLGLNDMVTMVNDNIPSSEPAEHVVSESVKYTSADIVMTMRTKWFSGADAMMLFPYLSEALANSAAEFDPYNVGNSDSLGASAPLGM